MAKRAQNRPETLADLQRSTPEIAVTDWLSANPTGSSWFVASQLGPGRAQTRPRPFVKPPAERFRLKKRDLEFETEENRRADFSAIAPLLSLTLNITTNRRCRQKTRGIYTTITLCIVVEVGI